MTDRKLASRLGLRGSLAIAVGLAVGVSLNPPGEALAQSLEEALAQAYSTNPGLDAERARLRATDELVPQALSGYRPQIEADAAVGRQHSYQEPGGLFNPNGAEDNSTSRSLTVGITQPLFNASTAPGVRGAENQVQAQRANLISAEQEVLLDAATAYLDVVRDQAILDLTVNNEQVLRRQFEAARDRFNVGELTRTDVSQAEARVARSTSDRIQAEGRLRASRATFARVVGTTPQKLSAPKTKFALPGSLDETIALAQSNNPNVVAAQFIQEAAEEEVDRIRGDLLPEASLSASVSRVSDPTETTEFRETGQITARLRIPIYEGGLIYSRVRGAKHSAAQRRILVDDIRRQVTENAIRAWEALTTARAAIQSRQTQVRSSEIALEGVRQEAVVGARTTLDALDAEQELLDAQVQLVAAQRDEMVAAFQVLAATGQLNARQLGLPVQYYDFEKHYKAVRGKWLGTDIGE